MNEQGTAAPPEPERRTEDSRSTMSLGGRRQAPRRAADRAKLLRDMAALVFALCGGLAVVYLFFAAFGAIDFDEAVTASVIALGAGPRLDDRVRLPAPHQRGARAALGRERRGF